MNFIEQAPNKFNSFIPFKKKKQRKTIYLKRLKEVDNWDG